MVEKQSEDWTLLTAQQKKRRLYESQKATLDAFLERKAISKAQYDKSLRDITEKMKINEESEP